MIKLYQFPFCPFSRRVRIVLLEKKLEHTIENVNFIERASKLKHLNPALEVPVLVDEETIICDSFVILEYLEEKYPEFPLMPSDLNGKIEVRRLANWFSTKFYNEVVKLYIKEKITRFYLNNGTADPIILRQAKANMLAHFDYLNSLLSQRKWLAGEMLTIADISAASQISLIDYLGEVNWEEWGLIKEWYILIKSRPSFRNLLNERIIGFLPSFYYKKLDF